MVTFDHRDRGTPESEWSASPEWASAPSLDPSRIGRLIVVAAHPDDETLGAAGLMRRVALSGGAVSVLLATDGEASHPHSPTHTAADLRERRAAEVSHALALISPQISLVRLGLRDGSLGLDAAELRIGIEAMVAAGDGPATLAATWRGDGHRDHQTVGEVSAAVAEATGARLLEYPIWMWRWSSPTGPATPWQQLCKLELNAQEQAMKRRAIAVHCSQTRALSELPGDEALLSEDFLEHFIRPLEAYMSIPESSGTTSLPREYFDDFYADNADPWRFETRWYEQRKRSLTMATLPRKRFHRALEVGCSNGILSEQLAERCDRLLATDIAAQPLASAQERLKDQPHVSFQQMTAPAEWPLGKFDLIVLSEIGYYLSEDALDELVRRAASSLSADGVLLACHWRHPVADYPLRGDDVHARFDAEPSLSRFVHHEEEDFLLALYGRPPTPSVARLTGLV